MTNKTILIVGGQGKLGSALGRLGSNALGRGELDILRPDSVAAALEAHTPELVINCAAYTAVDKAETDAEAAYAVNRDGAGNVAAACARHGVPLIHVSTDCVFGDGDPHEPVAETAPTMPLSVYGQSKRDGELAVQAASGPHCITRVSWLFDHSPQSFIGRMLAIADGRDKMQIVDDAHGRPTEVNALARRLLTLGGLMQAGKDVPSVLHFGPTKPVSRFEWAQTIFAKSATLGGPAPTLTPCSSDAFDELARRPRGLVLDTCLADGLLGGSPDWLTASDETVARILDRAPDTL